MRNDLRAFAVVLVLVAACGDAQHPTASSAPGLSTSVQSLHTGQVIDGVPCLPPDLPLVHNHIHLAILADGQPVTVPAGIGVGRPWGVDATGFITGGSCFAWLHTHDTSGLVHMVSSRQTNFTLLNLFEVWGQPLGPNSAAGYRGDLAVFVNGERSSADPRSIPLINFRNIVIELGKPPSVQPPALYDFTKPRA